MSKSLFGRLNRKYGQPRKGTEIRNIIDEGIESIDDSTVDFYHPHRSLHEGKSVIVIGAGFSGLSAAYHLAKRGFKMTILEARDRVGGRVKSLDQFANGQIIEGGAELIGSNHHLWVKLARHFGLSFNVVTQDDMFRGARLHEPLLIGGKDISEEEAERIYNLMDSIYDKLSDLASTVHVATPWTSPNAEELDKISLAQWLDEQVSLTGLPHVEKKLLRAALESDFANNNAVETNKQSLLGILTLVKAGGEGRSYWEMTEVYRCSAGNDALAKALKNDLSSQGHEIITDAPVSEIEINKTGKQKVTFTKKGEGVKQLEADYVVLAVPPSVWGNVKMPQEIYDYESQMGYAVKYLSALKSRFWVKPGFAPSGMADDLGMTWEGSDNQIVLPDREIELTVFSGGNLARQISAMTDREREHFYTTHLDTIFTWKDNNPRRDKYDKSDTQHHKYSDELAKAPKFQNWPAAPWTKGGYSFPAPGEICTKIKAQNEGYEDRLYFAGEHTCIAFVGYMEGALQSGLTVAKKIVAVEKSLNK